MFLHLETVKHNKLGKMPCKHWSSFEQRASLVVSSLSFCSSISFFSEVALKTLLI